jgi:hypothetical protein
LNTCSFLWEEQNLESANGIFSIGNIDINFHPKFMGFVELISKYPIKMLIAVLITIASIFGWHKHSVNQHHLSLIPNKLRDSKILYTSEET